MGNINVTELLQTLGVKAEKRGLDWWAICPDHDEKTPSWHINEDGSHHCFGCGFDGGPAELVGVVLGLDLKGALTWLRTNSDSRPTEQIPDEVNVVLRRTALAQFNMPDYSTGKLAEWVTPARRYAVARGLTDQQIGAWHLGFSVSGRLFGRLVIPIYDHRGKALSYHARTFVNHDKRYFYPDRSEHPDIGAIFGQSSWVEMLTVGKELILTEGAFDALACQRAGAPWIGAVGGSQPSPAQMLRLSRWRKIAVASDGDRAGDQMFETLARNLRTTTQVRRIQIPAGEDADALDPDHLKELLCQP